MSCCASQLQEELGVLPAGPAQPALCCRGTQLGSGFCVLSINTQKHSFLAKIASSSVLFLMADFHLLPPEVAEQH